MESQLIFIDLVVFGSVPRELDVLSVRLMIKIPLILVVCIGAN